MSKTRLRLKSWVLLCMSKTTLPVKQHKESNQLRGCTSVFVKSESALIGGVLTIVQYGETIRNNCCVLTRLSLLSDRCIQTQHLNSSTQPK